MIADSAHYTSSGGFEINEDSFICREGLYAVADGLGGHADGEKASAEAVRYLEENCNGGYDASAVISILEGANKAVLSLGGGGHTTVAAAFTENGYFTYANVGDSRVYYFRNGSIIAQTKDHSVCQANVDMGLMRFEDIRGSEDRPRLLKVLGNDEKLNIRTAYPPIKIENRDAFLICSDGFWEYVLESEMEADLLKAENAEKWLEFMLKRHYLASENKGDNYTVVCGFLYRTAEDDAADAAPAPAQGNIQYASPAVSQPAIAAKNESGAKKYIIIAAAVIAAVIIAIAVVLLAFPKSDEYIPVVPAKEVTGKDNNVNEENSAEENVPVQPAEQVIQEENTPVQQPEEQVQQEENTPVQQPEEQVVQEENTPVQQPEEQVVQEENTPVQQPEEQVQQEENTPVQQPEEQEETEENAEENGTQADNAAPAEAEGVQ